MNCKSIDNVFSYLINLENEDYSVCYHMHCSDLLQFFQSFRNHQLFSFRISEICRQVR